MSRNSDKPFRDQDNRHDRDDVRSNGRRDGQEQYRRPAVASKGSRTEPSGTHRPRRLDDAMSAARADDREQRESPAADQRFSSEIHRHGRRETLPERDSGVDRQRRATPQEGLDERPESRPRRSPAQNQWALQEENERRRRESLQRRQLNNNLNTGHQGDGSQRHEPYVQLHADDRPTAYQHESEPALPRRKKRGCLGYLFWFLLFIGLGYASIWFLIHGVSRWI